MELKLDEGKFDKHQESLIRELIEQVRFKLATAGIKGDELRDITGEVVFSVASTIDDTAGIVADGVDVKPYLTFMDEDGQLVHCGENAYGHELVATLIFEMFKKQPDDDQDSAD